MATEVSISNLTTDDVLSVDRLMKRHSNTLGFLPLVVIEDHLNKGSVLGAKTSDGRLVGYLLYAVYPNRFRIAQLCVARSFRGQGLASRLLDALIETATTQTVITLSCRNDFPAHNMWGKLQFVPMDEKVGRSKEGHLLTVWHRVIALGNQLELFQANVSDYVLDVIIDAQIFFDFDDPDSEQSLLSKTLLSDFFIDGINFWISDELFVEIRRNSDPRDREEKRARAKQFLLAKYDPAQLQYFVDLLKEILPSGNPNQTSDINHLAKAAASDVHVFVTRDKLLLNKAELIRAAVNVEVISPTALILRRRELAEAQASVPDRVMGLSLEWRQVNSSDYTSFPFERFLSHGEKLNQFRQRLDNLLSDRFSYELEVLWAQDEPVALRILGIDESNSVTLLLGRVERSKGQSSFGDFLVSDVVYKAVRKGIGLVKVNADALTLPLTHSIRAMGFVKYNGDYLRFCLPQHLTRRDTLSVIRGSVPEALATYEGMSVAEIERSCSPLLTDMNQSCFLVPIRPGYALNLFDRLLSSHSLFGGDDDVFIRWNNVYYRTNNRFKMLKPPGRILWYVSEPRKAIVAISHLDAVVTDIPKELFRRFRKYGTLAWEDLYRLCKGDVSTKLMALRFSHTFALRKEITLSQIRKVFQEDEIGLSLQGPIRVPVGSFSKLLKLGFPT